MLQELGLPVGAHIPMLGFIGRLDYQKGVDLIHENHGWMMGEGVQLILLGSGRADLEQALRYMLYRSSLPLNHACIAYTPSHQAHRCTPVLAVKSACNACDILASPMRNMSVQVGISV